MQRGFIPGAAFRSRSERATLGSGGGQVRRSRRRPLGSASAFRGYFLAGWSAGRGFACQVSISHGRGDQVTSLAENHPSETYFFALRNKRTHLATPVWYNVRRLPRQRLFGNSISRRPPAVNDFASGKVLFCPYPTGRLGAIGRRLARQEPLEHCVPRQRA